MRRAVLTGLMTLLAAGAFTQAATEAQREGVEQKRSYGTVHMASKIGSIRVLQAEGRLEMSFTGTLLVSKH
jgi:hypothetical protein